MIDYQDFEYEGKKVTFSIGEHVYVNATKMAKVFDKRPAKWLGLQSTQEFLNALSNVRHGDITPIITKRGNPMYGEYGTWFHRDVAIEFARWLSPAFAIWCNDKILELLTKGRVEIPRQSTALVVSPQVAKNDTITIDAMRAIQREFSLSDVGRMILWNGKPIRRRVLVAWMHDNNFLCYKDGCKHYPTEWALSLGLMSVIDKTKRGGNKKLLKPRVRVTMDGCNYLIKVLQDGFQGALKA